MKLFNKSLAKKAATAAIVAAMSFGAVALPAASAGQPQDQVPLLRLYNPYSGEHLFTTNRYEASDLVFRGWRSERSDGLVNLKEGTPVFRLYNEWTGDHHYTSDTNEVNACIRQGWTNEGIQFCSDEDATTDVYSMYNPYATKFYHHYTADANEMAKMQSDGWRQENVKWRVITDGRSKVVAPVDSNENADNPADTNGTSIPSILPSGEQSGNDQSVTPGEHSSVTPESSSSDNSADTTSSDTSTQPSAAKKKLYEGARFWYDNYIVHGWDPDFNKKVSEHMDYLNKKVEDKYDELMQQKNADGSNKYTSEEAADIADNYGGGRYSNIWEER